MAFLRLDRGRVTEFAYFFASVLALQGSRFVFTLVVAAGTRPEDFIAWAQFSAIVAYAPSVLLGTGNGMNRAIPILIGRGEHEEADEAESATWSLVGVVMLASVAITALLSRADVAVWLAPAVLAGGAMTVYQVQQFSMRSRLMFARASTHQLGWACLMGIGCVALFRSDGSLASGLWIWTTAALAALVVGYALRRPIVKHPSSTRTLQLLAMGFPIMLSGLVGSLFYTADRWVASIRLEPSVAGIYGLASLIASAAFLVPIVIGQQQYPRLAILYGGGASREELSAAARRQSLVAASASLLTAAGVAAFSLIVIPLILPDYRQIAEPVVILSLGIAALAGSTGYANLMIVIGAQWVYLAILATSFGIAAAMMWLGSGLGGAVGLALGVAAGQVVLLVSVIAATRFLASRRAVHW